MYTCLLKIMFDIFLGIEIILQIIMIFLYCSIKCLSLPWIKADVSRRKTSYSIDQALRPLRHLALPCAAWWFFSWSFLKWRKRSHHSKNCKAAQGSASQWITPITVMDAQITYVKELASANTRQTGHIFTYYWVLVDALYFDPQIAIYTMTFHTLPVCCLGALKSRYCSGAFQYWERL